MEAQCSRTRGGTRRAQADRSAWRSPTRRGYPGRLQPHRAQPKGKANGSSHASSSWQKQVSLEQPTRVGEAIGS
jgi:hypothetical protein